MSEMDEEYDWDFEQYWDAGQIRDDLLLCDAVRILEMWEGQKVSRIERRSRKKQGKPEKVRGPHAVVDHETKDAVKEALSSEDFKAVGSDNPDIYIKSKGNGEDDDLIVVVRPATHANSVGRGKKHVTNIHARDILGDDYRDKLNVLKLTTQSEPDVWILTVITMANERTFVFVQHQVEDSILRD